MNGSDACDCGPAGAPSTDGQLKSKNCSSIASPTGGPFSGGTLRCNSPSHCSFDTSGCYYCGDGAINAGEECDGLAVGGTSCSALGYASGTVACSQTCRLDLSGRVLVNNPHVVCSNPLATIPDGDAMGVSDTIQILAAGRITDVNVVLRVSHGWAGDVKAELTHGSTTRTLLDRPGVPETQWGCDGRDIDATLDDEGTNPAESACRSTAPAISGVLTPDQRLAVLDGQGIGGTWTLRVVDVAPAFGGKLVEWCLGIAWQ